MSSFSSSPTAQQNQANMFMQLNNCVPKFPELAWQLRLQNALYRKLDRNFEKIT